MNPRVPRWPVMASRAIAFLFRETQDIEIYVEDAASEQFYLTIANRLKPKHVKVSRVVALHGREKVLAAARSYVAQKKAIFIIDGDFEWVRGDAKPDVPRVLRWEAYCVENLFFSKENAEKLFMEEAGLDPQSLSGRFDFEAWVVTVRAQLTRLFCHFALACNGGMPEASSSKGVGPFLKDALQWVLSEEKVLAKAQELADKLCRQWTSGEFERRLNEVVVRVGALPEPLDAVSGKTFVIPLLLGKIKSLTESKASYRTIYGRLSATGDLSKFWQLKDALL